MLKLRTQGALPAMNIAAQRQSSRATTASAAGQAGSSPAAAAVAIEGAAMPPLLYGTAWKKERTADLVELAIRTGFRAVDTACQPRHYNEAGVGAALRKLMNEGVVQRGDIFLQTKYTPSSGQDPNNTPYDRNAPLRVQVQQSFQKSLENLGTNYLDSLLVHSPLPSLNETLEVWHEFESIHGSGGALRLGISNCYDADVLKALYAAAQVKPTVLQNRFYRDSGYDVAIRNFCLQNGIVYQSFWTLTANPNIVNSNKVSDIARRRSATNQQIFFRFVGSQGITFLTGTSSKQHMEEDLAAPDITLEASEIEAIKALLK